MKTETLLILLGLAGVGIGLAVFLPKKTAAAQADQKKAAGGFAVNLGIEKFGKS